MRYYNRIQIDARVYENIKSFIRAKNDSDNLFDIINAGKLNDYLRSLMPGLSAKVFRTYNASVTLQQELDRKQFDEMESTEAKVSYYNEANKQVAILCNHQKTVSKNYNVLSEAMQVNLKEHITYLIEMEEHMISFKKSKKKEKKEMKGKEKEEKEDEGKNKLKKTFPDSEEKTEKLIENIKKKIKGLEEKMKSREELKQIALGTSKLNYMDPRITVSWCKENEVGIEKIFTKSVRDKFPWAMYAKPDYKF